MNIPLIRNSATKANNIQPSLAARVREIYLIIPKDNRRFFYKSSPHWISCSYGKNAPEKLAIVHVLNVSTSHAKIDRLFEVTCL